MEILLDCVLKRGSVTQNARVKIRERFLRGHFATICLCDCSICESVLQ